MAQGDLQVSIVLTSVAEIYALSRMIKRYCAIQTNVKLTVTT